MVPSRLAEWVLACAAQAEDREAVAGDLAEEYAIRLQDDSRVRAVCWYCSQLFRSVPWLLWAPVRRSGLFSTLGIALAACIVQAAIEISAAQIIRKAAAPEAAGSLLIGLAVVLTSLFVVSYVAARVRPGAGTLLTLMAFLAVVAQSIAMGAAALSLSHLVSFIAAPSATFAGAAFSSARVSTG
jgi:branched-subunit amino acid transport protein AzlD